ncbi:MAG TPA: hypothetical protein PL012_09055 [Candidatus Obscuribacter sp.]|nr:hypothetical protein [Candidatus Obscuribacter sp.]
MRARAEKQLATQAGLGALPQTLAGGRADSKRSLLCLSLSFGLSMLMVMAGDVGQCAPLLASAPDQGQNPGKGGLERRDLTPYCQAEAGVKLLMGIFSRLGNEPQLALKNEMQNRKADLRQEPVPASLLAGAGNISDVSQGQLSKNYTDPALAIRPQQTSVRRLTVGRAVINKVVPIDGMTIAMAPRGSVNAPAPAMQALPSGAGGAAGDSLAPAAPPASFQSQGQGLGASTRNMRPSFQGALPRAEGQRYAQQAGGYSSNSDALQEKVATNKLLDLKSQLNQGGGASKPVNSIPYLAGSLHSTMSPMQDKSRLKEFNSESKRTSYGGASEGLNRGRRIEENLSQASYDEGRVVQTPAAEPSVNGIIRPAEQPGLFKYVREHRLELPKDAPREIASRESRLDTKDGFRESERDQSKSVGQEELSYGAVPEAVKVRAAKQVPRRKATAASEASQKESTADSEWMQEVASKKAKAERQERFNQASPVPLVAYLPPSTLRGISGLPLGSSEKDTLAYLKSRGKFKTAESHGWRVYTLSSAQGNVALQAYLRSGKLEALRVYNADYLPASLGVSIESELSTMKSKFGEPSFVLDEPPANRTLNSKLDKGAAPAAKNYVYPLSQVGFQLARPSAGASPQVMSVLFFRYL